MWRASDEMHERKFKKFYRMSYPAFNNLVQLLTPFLRSECQSSDTSVRN